MGHERVMESRKYPWGTNLPGTSLEAALEAEGFRRFREMRPLYHRVDPQGSQIPQGHKAHKSGQGNGFHPGPGTEGQILGFDQHT